MGQSEPVKLYHRRLRSQSLVDCLEQFLNMMHCGLLLFFVISRCVESAGSSLHEEFYALEEYRRDMPVKRVFTDAEYTAAFNSLDLDSESCPDPLPTPLGGGHTNTLDLVMEQLYTFLSGNEYAKFLDLCTICARPRKDSSNRSLMKPSEHKDIKKKELKNIKTTDYDASIKKVIEEVLIQLDEDKFDALGYAIVRSYIHLHSILLSINNIVAVFLEKCKNAVDGNLDLRRAYPVLHAILSEEDARKNKHVKEYFLGLATDNEMKKKYQDLYDMIVLQQQTLAYLKTTLRLSDNFPITQDPSLDDKDRRKFVQYLIAEDETAALARYLEVKVVKPSTVSPAVPPIKAARKPSNIIETSRLTEAEIPSRQLLQFESKNPCDNDDPFDEIFEGLLYLFGAQMQPEAHVLNQYIKESNNIQIGICGAISLCPSKNNEDRITGNAKRLFLTLGMMNDQEYANNVFEMVIERCRPFGRGEDQKKAIYKALKYPEESEYLSPLLYRSYFDPSRAYRLSVMYQMQQKLLEDRTEDMTGNGVTLKKSKVGAKFAKGIMGPFSNEEFMRESLLLTPEHERLLENTFKFHLERMKQGSINKNTLIEWSDQFIQVINELLNTEVFKKLYEFPIFLDLIEMLLLLEKDVASIFINICSNGRCRDVPLNLVRCFREKVLVQLAAKKKVSTDAEREKIMDEIYKLQDRYIKIFSKMNNVLTSHYNIFFNTVGFCSPGLLDHPELYSNYNWNYEEAMELTDLPLLRALQPSFYPWHKVAMFFDENIAESVLSNLLIRALVDENLYAIMKITSRPNLSCNFRNSEGFRFFILWMLMQSYTHRIDPDGKLNFELFLSHKGFTVNRISDLAIAKDETKGLLTAPKSTEASPSPWKIQFKKDLDDLAQDRPLSKARILHSPSEYFLFLACTKLHCPFEPVDTVEKTFVFSDYASADNDAVIPRPTLESPYDGFAADWLLWFVDILGEEIRHLIREESLKPKRMGITSSDVRKFGPEKAPHFEKVIMALIKYMAVDPKKYEPIIRYAHYIIHSG